MLCSAPLELNDASSVWRCFGAFLPSRAGCTLDWAIEHVVNEHGRPFDHASYPHLGAPGGPFDANDDPSVRTISMQWGSRLGKTFGGQVMCLHQAATDPAPMMLASPSEELTKQVVRRTYKMIRKRVTLLELMLRSERFWKQNHIEFRECDLWGAWSRSPATLADKNCKRGLGVELDKWDFDSTSTEGDPQKLFTDRFKDCWSTRKVVFESTPAIAGRSRIEKLRQAGTDCRFYVPCPHCKRYQTLELGREGQAWGIKWDREADGKSSYNAARQTARYVCRHCEGECRDHHRPWMMRHGVWSPSGAEVIDAEAMRVAVMRSGGDGAAYSWSGWQLATWVRNAPPRISQDASYQLSSLYALALSWGDIAAEFLACKDKPRELQSFVNGWLGLTWEPVKQKSTVEQIAARIGNGLPQGTAPLWGRILVVAVDRQGADGGFVKYAVIAGGDGDRAAVVEYGIKLTLEDVWREVSTASYPHEDGGPPMFPVVTGVDSGWDTKVTYDFCGSHPHCFPLKGSNTDLGSLPQKVAVLDGATRSGAANQILIHVNTDYWESDLQYRLDNRGAGEDGCLSANKVAVSDDEFLGELTNGILADKVDARGNAKLLWIKKDENKPNDWRDAVRYGLCLLSMERELRKGFLPARSTAPQQAPRESATPAAVAESPASFVRHPKVDNAGGWIRRPR